MAWALLPGLGLLLGSCSGSAQEDVPSTPPNVLLIVVDTLRQDHLSLYGHTRRTSPALDAFSERCLVYERAYAQAPWTTPSIGALLSSRYPTSLGIRGDRSVLPSDVTTLPEVLSGAGYRTAAVVSHSFCSERWGFAQGFTDFDESNVLGHDAVTSEGVTERGLAFLEGPGVEAQPWFLWLHYFDPHCAYIEQSEAFAGTEPYEGPVRSGQLYSELWKQRRSLTAPDFEELRRLYDSEIHHTDHQVGRILEHLEREGLLENTIVVITADHGEEFGDHGSLGHARTLHEELIRVPLLIHVPGTQPGRLDTPVALIDVYPTLLESLGLEAPTDLEGQDILPGGVGLEPGRVVFSETQRGNRLRAAIDATHKVVLQAKRPVPTVYDLSADPAGLEALEGRPGVVPPALHQELLTWWDRVRQGARDETTLDLSAGDETQLEQLGYGGGDGE